MPALRAPSVASRTAGARAGATRSANPKWSAAWSSAPATNAVRPGVQLGRRIRAGHGRGLDVGLAIPEAEHDRCRRRRLLDPLGGDPILGAWCVPVDRGGRSGSRSNRVGAVGGGSAGSPGHTLERGMPAKIRSTMAGAPASTRLAIRRASLGRPTADAASAAMTSAITAPSSSRSAALAASPAPSRSPVRQRTSARSTRPRGSSSAETGHRLELDPRQRQRAEPQMRVGEDRFDRSGDGFDRRPGRGRRGGHDGSRRRGSSPRR